MIAALHYLEFLPDFIEEGGQHWSTEDVSRGLQDYLICIGIHFDVGLLFK